MTIINILQVIISLILSTLIILQPNDAGMGSITGNQEHTRRGSEKAIFQATIILAILFIGLSMINLFF